MTNSMDRRTALKTIGTGVSLAVVGTGGASARMGRRQGASAEHTIFDIVEEGDDFTVLELALEETGLDAVLDGAGGQYTVFAPTDAAFAALLADLDISAADLLASDDLATILLYHVTRGRRYASSVVNAPGIRMLNGGTVAVDGVVLNGGQATIQATDVEASNGVVHVLDGVLLP